MAGLNLFTNNAATTLASGLLIGDTSLTVAVGTGAEFPTLAGAEYFFCTIANNTGSIEIIKVTARSTDTFTIVRGQDGTSAAAWSAGDKVELRLTRIDLLNFPQLDSTNTFAAVQTFTVNPLMNGLTASKPVFTDASKNLTSTGTVAVDQGGTGQTSYTNGELLIGNTTGNTLTKTTLTAGNGVTITNGAGAITIASSGGFSNMTVFTSPGTFTTPATTTQIKVTVVGGGGGGGNSPAPGNICGGGGGGGAAVYVGPVAASSPFAVTVGTGGASAAAGNTSSFAALASATGGGAGTSTAPAGSGPGAGGAGGAGSAGTLQVKGGTGLRGLYGISNAMPGGNSILGGAGRGSVGAGSGSAGGDYGGGGGGASGPGAAGGAGAGGVVIVEY